MSKITIKTLLKALLEYGRHTDDCDVHHGSDCNCGIEELRIEAKKALKK